MFFPAPSPSSLEWFGDSSCWLQINASLNFNWSCRISLLHLNGKTTSWLGSNNSAEQTRSHVLYQLPLFGSQRIKLPNRSFYKIICLNIYVFIFFNLDQLSWCQCTFSAHTSSFFKFLSFISIYLLRRTKGSEIKNIYRGKKRGEEKLMIQEILNKLMTSSCGFHRN